MKEEQSADGHCRILHITQCNRLRILFRLKSEVVTGNHHHLSYNDQMFSVISEVMRSHVSVPLPVPIDAQTQRSMVKLQPDRIIFATDFVFRKR
ncbi:hypothetical protein KIN20_018152 [Parelaphostrongylus tenuis]|uniref:Uncharacterized protein n=1 Tax=Parelaphostrongylus tenuis TaxID=148309 RepID=A0AAD5QRA2_PARTN|nr:hypothetical protein KIN20_018152 [Parelaphostrongylus tenuis]